MPRLLIATNSLGHSRRVGGGCPVIPPHRTFARISGEGCPKYLVRSQHLSKLRAKRPERGIHFTALEAGFQLLLPKESSRPCIRHTLELDRRFCERRAAGALTREQQREPHSRPHPSNLLPFGSLETCFRLVLALGLGALEAHPLQFAKA